MEQEAGLERLRCIEDRRLAADLLELYFVAERNSSDEKRARERAQEERRLALDEEKRLRRLAERARDGERGMEARELAEHLLLNERGQKCGDAASLRTFERALRRLRSTE
jgi:hypothetical protein